jgi:hypothetical protein
VSQGKCKVNRQSIHEDKYQTLIMIDYILWTSEVHQPDPIVTWMHTSRSARFLFFKDNFEIWPASDWQTVLGPDPIYPGKQHHSIIKGCTFEDCSARGSH